VVDDGRVVEQGAHADLLGRGGPYAAMWRAFEGDPGMVEATVDPAR
jgi:ATP-binding cassette subfamily B protein